VPIGRKLRLCAEVVRKRRRLLTAKAVATFEDGAVAAEALATLWVIEGDELPD